jgi:hypothetical protein
MSGETEENYENPRHNNQDSNGGPPEYKSRKLLVNQPAR